MDTKNISKEKKKFKKNCKKITTLFNTKVLCGSHVPGLIQKGKFELAQDYLDRTISQIETGICIGFW